MQAANLLSSTEAAGSAARPQTKSSAGAAADDVYISMGGKPRVLPVARGSSCELSELKRPASPCNLAASLRLALVRVPASPLDRHSGMFQRRARGGGGRRVRGRWSSWSP